MLDIDIQIESFLAQNESTSIYRRASYSSALNIDDNDAILPNKHHEIFMRQSGGRSVPSMTSYLFCLPTDASQHERLAAATNDPLFFW